MREIKFRAYFHNEKVMIYDVQDAYKGHVGKPHPLESSYALSFGELLALEHNGMNHHTVMQYTGKLDKNGKEIYEGDIVNAIELALGDDWLPSDKILSQREAEVHWSETNCGWVLMCNDFETGNEPISIFDSLEVIGNIYENPTNAQ